MVLRKKGTPVILPSRKGEEKHETISAVCRFVDNRLALVHQSSGLQAIPTGLVQNARRNAGRDQRRCVRCRIFQEGAECPESCEGPSLCGVRYHVTCAGSVRSGPLDKPGAWG